MFGEMSSGVVVACMGVLAALLTRHYVVRRNEHALWWAVSFWVAFLAATTDFASYLANGWTPVQYRVYLWSAAALVAYMGAGTVFLFSRRLGRVYAAVMSLIAAAMAVALIATPFPDISRMPPGEQAQGFVPGSIAPYFGVLSGVGALALFAGALYSYFRTRRGYNLWIALGALIFSAGGTAGSLLGVFELFYAFQAVGSVILYVGVVRSFHRSAETEAKTRAV